MGQEIVYCDQCQGQVRGSDFSQGAVRIDHLSYCPRCAPAVLRELPPEKVREIRAASESQKAAPRNPGSSTFRIPTSPAPKTSRVPRVAGPSPQGKAMVLAFVAVAVIVIGLAVGLGKGRSEPETAPPRPVEPPVARAPRLTPPEKPPAVLPAAPSPAPAPPVVAPLPRPKPAELSRDPKRQAEGQEALRAAREARSLRPKEFVQNFELAQKAFFAAEGMPWADEAKQELDACRKQLTEFLDSELVSLDKEIRASCEKEDFKTALDTIEKAGKAHEGSQWSLALSKRKREVGEAAFKLFESLKTKAQEAKEANLSEDLKAIGDRIAKWGIPEFVARFQKLEEER